MNRLSKISTLSAMLLAALQVCGQSPALAYENGFIPAQEAETHAKSTKYNINWLTSLPDAQERAHREHKPILWIHLLGNIDGFT